MAIFNKSNTPAVSLEEQQRIAEQHEAELIYRQGVVTMRDLIAPPSLEIESGYIRLGKRFAKTVYVYGYPRQVFTGWLSPLINLDEVIDISIYVYPVESRVVLENLKRKVGQLEADFTINQEKGRVRDPGLEAAIQDAEELRDKLQVGEERFFRFSLYLTMYANSLDELTQISRKIEGIFGQSLVYTKPANNDYVEYGLIAEQAAETLPEIVQWMDGKIHGVRYDLLAVALLETVQHQQREIDHQKAVNAAIRAALHKAGIHVDLPPEVTHPAHHAPETKANNPPPHPEQPLPYTIEED